MAKAAGKGGKELERLLTEYAEGLQELCRLYDITPQRRSARAEKRAIRAVAAELAETEDQSFDVSSIYTIIESGKEMINRTIQLLEKDLGPVQPCLAMDRPAALSDADRESLRPRVIEHDQQMKGLIKGITKQHTTIASRELGLMDENCSSVFKKIGIDVNADETSGLTEKVSIMSQIKIRRPAAPLKPHHLKQQDSSPWKLITPLEDTSGANVKYSFIAMAGMYECSETGLRWRSTSDVGLEYCFVDWKSLSKDLKKLKYQPYGPLMDITVSNELEEIHLPHYICVDSVSSSDDAVKALHVKDGDISLKTCELTKFHAKFLNPTFSFWGVVAEIQACITMTFFCETYIYRCRTSALSFHVYLTVRDRNIKKYVEEKEKGNILIVKPSPDDPQKMKEQFKLKTSCDSIIKPERLTLMPYKTNFFDVRFKKEEPTIELHLMKNGDIKIWDVDIRADEIDTNRSVTECDQATRSSRNKPVHEILLQYLEDLKSEELEDFKWHLTKGVEHFRKIPESRLEKTRRCDVVKCMIDQYKADGAAKLTVIILRKMQRNNDAELLQKDLE